MARKKPRKRLLKVKRELFAEDPSCHWCGKELSFKSATLDHLVPRSRGGSDSSMNLVLSCEECNSDKADRMDYSQDEARRKR